MINIGIAGTGNLAFHLADVCRKHNFNLKFIAGRNINTTKMLANQFATDAYLLSNTLPKTDVLFLAVSDDALPKLSISISKNVLLVHCAGAVPLHVLKKYSANIGVFYPLQTFSKQAKVDWKDTPVFIEASSIHNLTVLQSLANKISSRTTVLDSEQRLWVHLSAVFASNFTAIMLVEAFALCEDNKLDAEILKPLVMTTINNAFALKNEEALTGPAKRKDRKTQNLHNTMLAEKPKLQKLYKILSGFIESKSKTL